MEHEMMGGVCLSVRLSVCLERASTWRTERSRKSKIGRMETHHTGNPWSYFKSIKYIWQHKKQNKQTDENEKVTTKCMQKNSKTTCWFALTDAPQITQPTYSENIKFNPIKSMKTYLEVKRSKEGHQADKCRHRQCTIRRSGALEFSNKKAGYCQQNVRQR